MPKYITDSKNEVGNEYGKNRYHVEATYRRTGARLSSFKPWVHCSLALWLHSWPSLTSVFLICLIEIMMSTLRAAVQIKSIEKCNILR